MAILHKRMVLSHVTRVSLPIHNSIHLPLVQFGKFTDVSIIWPLTKPGSDRIHPSFQISTVLILLNPRFLPLVLFTSHAHYHFLRYCKIHITVEDVNDNYPFFPTWHYEGSVWKDAAIGTSILTIHAFDFDSEVNSKAEYHFAEANDKFAISKEGVISTKTSLKSSLGTWTYRVIVSDMEPMTVGEVDPEKRKTRIEVYVSDLEPPKFTKSVFTGSITENSKPSKPITSVTRGTKSLVLVEYLFELRS